MSETTGTSSMSKELMAKCFVEMVGTTLLAFTVATAAVKAGDYAGVGIGSALMCAIYAGGHISGAHFNPAVTLACVVRQCCDPKEAVSYVVSQIIGGYVGGLFGALAMGVEIGTIGHPAVAAGVGSGSALLAEIILTFALCHTVIGTATTTFADGKTYYGLAIGFTVLSGAISVGGISGGAFNPAVGMLTTMTTDAADIWIYLVGPLLGGALAGSLFQLTHPSEVKKDPSAPKPQYTDFAIEFVGTFMLCYTVACAAGQGAVLAEMSIGSMLMSMVYAGGPTSGGHYNPAVTIAVFMRSTYFGKEDSLPANKAVSYIVTQLIAALAAGGLALVTLGNVSNIGFPYHADGYGYGTVWFAEMFATFFLAFVVLETATAPATAGNSNFGLAIGFTVTAMAFAIGGVTGGALNPAVGLLGIFTKIGPIPWVDIFGIYWTACPVGGILASIAYRSANFKEFEVEPTETTPLTAA